MGDSARHRKWQEVGRPAWSPGWRGGNGDPLSEWEAGRSPAPGVGGDASGHTQGFSIKQDEKTLSRGQEAQKTKAATLQEGPEGGRKGRGYLL